MPATSPSPKNGLPTPPLCPTCAMTMRLISYSPIAGSVVYDYLCNSDGDFLSWRPTSLDSATGRRRTDRTLTFIRARPSNAHD